MEQGGTAQTKKVAHAPLCPCGLRMVRARLSFRASTGFETAVYMCVQHPPIGACECCGTFVGPIYLTKALWNDRCDDCLHYVRDGGEWKWNPTERLKELEVRSDVQRG